MLNVDKIITIVLTSIQGSFSKCQTVGTKHRDWRFLFTVLSAYQVLDFSVTMKHLLRGSTKGL